MHCRWSLYGGYQRAIWYQLDRRRGVEDPSQPQEHSEAEVVAVQALAALLGGCTSAVFTNPLDVIKTRLQVCCMGPAKIVDSDSDNKAFRKNKDTGRTLVQD